MRRESQATFALTIDSAPSWVDAHGLNPDGVHLNATELTGGVSALVVAVTGEGVALVLKQALRQLRVADVWEASPARSQSRSQRSSSSATSPPGRCHACSPTIETSTSSRSSSSLARPQLASRDRRTTRPSRARGLGRADARLLAREHGRAGRSPVGDRRFRVVRRAPAQAVSLRRSHDSPAAARRRHRSLPRRTSLGEAIPVPRRLRSDGRRGLRRRRGCPRRSHRLPDACAHRRRLPGRVSRRSLEKPRARDRDLSARSAGWRALVVGLIERVLAWEALDSRGTPTVACAVWLEGGASGTATVPSGASTGSHEARERRDGGVRFGGRGVRDAVATVNGEIAALLLGRDARRPARGRPGAAGARRHARSSGSGRTPCSQFPSRPRSRPRRRRAPLYRALAPGGEPLLPLPMVNILSGGAHAGRCRYPGLARRSARRVAFGEAIEWAARVRAATASCCRRVATTSLVADEGGLAARLPSNRAASSRRGRDRGERLEPGRGGDRGRRRSHAAVRRRRYRLTSEGRTLTAGELVAELRGWCDAFPIDLDRGSARRG